MIDPNQPNPNQQMNVNIDLDKTEQLKCENKTRVFNQNAFNLQNLTNVDDLFEPRTIMPRTDRDLSVLVPNPTTRSLFGQ